MTEPLLALEHVHKSFGALKATNDVSLDLRPGEIHALIGPNGAGKSTLIHQVTGFLAPDSGAIRFLDRDVSHMTVAQRAQAGLGRTFQVSSLIGEYSVLRNVMLAVQSVSGSSFRFFRPVAGDHSLMGPAREALEQVGLSARENVRVAALSHGERRQLELAIALALKPKALLLDEPMAGLGPEGSLELTRLLDGLRAQVPILLIEHDMDAVFSLADRISVLVYGEIIASGSVEEIRADPAVRAAYLDEDDA